MANSYTKIYIHATFVVKHRAALIAPAWKEELFKFICGIANNDKQKILRINSMPDHMHILLSLNGTMSMANIMRDIKANSSRFINERKFTGIRFEWQSGYGAFSVGHTQVETVSRYIDNQEEHHRKKTFRKEYVQLLEENQVDYNPEYLFEEIDTSAA